MQRGVRMNLTPRAIGTLVGAAALVAQELRHQKDRGGLFAGAGSWRREPALGDTIRIKCNAPGSLAPGAGAGSAVARRRQPVPLAGQRAIPYLARARQQGS